MKGERLVRKSNQGAAGGNPNERSPREDPAAAPAVAAAAGPEGAWRLFGFGVEA